MYNKIAFVCGNPWENLLSDVFQGNAKYYYDWLCHQAALRKMKSYCGERRELYGHFQEKHEKREPLFMENSDVFQFLYVQGKQQKMLEQILPLADFIVVGMPECKTECDRIYLSILPWKEKSLFLWDGKNRRGKDFLKKLQREYKLRDTQIVEIKELPSF